MIEIALLFLFVLNIMLIMLLVWEKIEGRLERQKMINAIVAKNAVDMANLDMADKTEIKLEKPKPSEYTSLENLSQEEWEKAVLNG